MRRINSDELLTDIDDQGPDPDEPFNGIARDNGTGVWGEAIAEEMGVRLTS